MPCEVAQFDVQCPRCGRHACAHMYQDGGKGSYREVLVRLVAKQIDCPSCACLIRADSALCYKLWFVSSYRGHPLWVNNRKHAMLLVAYLRDELSPSDQQMFSAELETLPRWMIVKNHRRKIAKKLLKMVMKQDGACAA